MNTQTRNPLTPRLRFPTGVTVKQVKKEARKLKKQKGITLHQALDIMARVHGIDKPWGAALKELYRLDANQTIISNAKLQN